MAEEISKCGLPLESADFAQFDRQPDGILYRNEFSDEELDCFVNRLLLTGDSEIKSVFTNNMKTSLWEAIREKLLAIPDESLAGDTAIRKRDLLENEFNDKIWSVSGNVNFSAGRESTHRNDNGSESDAGKLTLKLVEQSYFNLAIPHKLWKSYLSIGAGGEHYWLQEKYRDDAYSVQEDYEHSGVVWNASFTEKLRSDAFAISIYTQGNFFPDPSPDCLASKYIIKESQRHPSYV